MKPDEATKQPQVFSVWGGSSASVGVPSFFFSKALVDKGMELFVK